MKYKVTITNESDLDVRIYMNDEIWMYVPKHSHKKSEAFFNPMSSKMRFVYDGEKRKRKFNEFVTCFVSDDKEISTFYR